MKINNKADIKVRSQTVKDMHVQTVVNGFLQWAVGMWQNILWLGYLTSYTCIYLSITMICLGKSWYSFTYGLLCGRCLMNMLSDIDYFRPGCFNCTHLVFSLRMFAANEKVFKLFF